MSKPIKLTEKVIEGMAKEFAEALRKSKLSDGKVTYSKQFAYEDGDNATLVFTTMAYAKMTMLVQSFDCEIAWHASCRRDEEDKTKFYIDDIIVYPQEVTGVTVTMDEAKYGAWLQKGFMDGDERFDRIHFQGHSHVNMGVSPSGTDIEHQNEILSQLPDDSYYIFIIANKKFEYTIRVFDLANNVMYENKEVNLLIGEDSVDLAAFVSEAKELAPKKVYQYTGGNSYAGGTANANPPAKTQPQTQSQPQKQYGGYAWGRGRGYYDDYYKDYIDGYGGY